MTMKAGQSALLTLAMVLVMVEAVPYPIRLDHGGTGGASGHQQSVPYPSKLDHGGTGGASGHQQSVPYPSKLDHGGTGGASGHQQTVPYPSRLDHGGTGGTSGHQQTVPYPSRLDHGGTGARVDSSQNTNTSITTRRRDPQCDKLPAMGECRGHFARYFYKPKTDQCDCFIYDGCGLNGMNNIFLTLEECHQTCLPEHTQEGPECKTVFENLLELDLVPLEPVTPGTKDPHQGSSGTVTTGDKSPHQGSSGTVTTGDKNPHQGSSGTVTTGDKEPTPGIISHSDNSDEELMDSWNYDS